MGRPRVIFWTEEMDEILKKYYPSKQYEKIFEETGINNLDYIRHKASDLGVRVDSRSYTDYEREFVANNFEKMSYREIGEIIGRNQHAVCSILKQCGIDKVEVWSEEEISTLRDVYAWFSNKDLEEKFFKNRKAVNIRSKALKLGLHKDPNRSQKRYNKEKMISDLINLSIRLGRTPSIDELVCNGLPSDTSYRRYFGGYRDACVIAGLEINASLWGSAKIYMSSVGDICFSKSELVITEFFIENNIPYKKDVPYADIILDDMCGTKVTDWVMADGSIVEFWGYPKEPTYVVGMNTKREICKNNEINLIELERNDISKLRNIFGKYL